MVRSVRWAVLAAAITTAIACSGSGETKTGGDSQTGAATRRERQDAENRLRIRFRIAVETLKSETALKLARNAYEVRGGTCVKTETTGDLDPSFSQFQSAPDLEGGSSKAPAR